MFPKFADVLNAIEDLKERGLIQDYAIFGAIAQMFWDEARPTFDLDVLVLLAGGQGALVSLAPIYEWASAKGYEAKGEHIVISEIPVQFVPATDRLHEEAVENASMMPFGEHHVRVVRSEYLIATWLKPPANSPDRRERAARLRESVQVDKSVLAELLKRYNLTW